MASKLDRATGRPVPDTDTGADWAQDPGDPLDGRKVRYPGWDPNPRLETYVEAARQGAQVRVLLDGYCDDPADPRGNRATCDYLNALAQREGLDLQARLGNPTGLGIHNKMVLARIGGRGYVHLGSINGSKDSTKANRELAVQVQADAAYAHLAAVFAHDWEAAPSPYRIYLPVIKKN